MTCFWNAIISSMNIKVFAEIFEVNNTRRINPKQMVSFFKKHSKATKNVTWNGKKLRDQEIKENMQWIKELNINSIGSGHDCSISNPFLTLFCELFRVNIDHQYLNNTIQYRYVGNNHRGITLRFRSNRGHFSFVGSK